VTGGPDGVVRDLILDGAYGFVATAARTGAIFALLPGLGETGIPATVKAGLILTVTLVLQPVVAPLLPPRPAADAELARLIAVELANGLWFGWLARVVVASLPLAGQFVADVSGLSNVLMPSPDSGAQTSAISRLYETAVPALILSSGLYMLPLSALAGFYRLVPPGTLPWAGDGAAASVAAVAASFELALRLAAPFVLTGFAWNLAVGLIARFVPRMQVFFVAMPGQIGLALILLALLSVPLLAAWMEAVRTGLAALPGGGG